MQSHTAVCEMTTQNAHPKPTDLPNSYLLNQTLHFFPGKTAMKSLTRHLTFTIPARVGFENITSTVADLVTESGIQEGLCLVKPHITQVFSSTMMSLAYTTIKNGGTHRPV